MENVTSEIDKFLIFPTDSISQTLQVLENGGLGVALLVDFDGKFIRTVTDGDVRRLIISGASLDDALTSLSAGKATSAQEGVSELDILQLMDEREIDHMPVLSKGGSPVQIYHRRDIDKKIQLSIPHLGSMEKAFVEEAFNTNWIAPLGPNVDAFEEEISDYVGVASAAATVSGTAAIHLALRLAGVRAGDKVLCASFTFVASAGPILYQGAEPVFIDSDPDCWNMSPQAMERALKDMALEGCLPKAIIVVHLYGVCADMDEIMSIANAYDVPVIEDAAESLGSTYKGRQSGTLGAYGVFSFNGNKIITTSGGGMLVSNDTESINRARYLSTQARAPAPHYEHTEIGYNYRMSNVLAGIGRGQLKVLDDRVGARRAIFERYVQGLGNIGSIKWMPELPECRSNRWLSAAIIDPSMTDIRPADVINTLAEMAIEARHAWKPMHMQPVFEGCRYYEHQQGIDSSRFLFENGICLPSASSMTEAEQDKVIACIQSIFS